ncbi:MAG: FAD:protein FMN transferase [Candidatus Omnitrophica bacterium]|nr:FAD:protein FMN transferase [Candidatus Omnitrophota bacterium]
MKRSLLLVSSFFLVIVIIVIVAGSLFAKTEIETRAKMGTFVEITLQGPKWQNFEGALDAAFSAIDKVERIASIYDKESEVSRLNQLAHVKPTVVSDELFILISDSIKLSKASDGAFDITVAPLVKLWREYRNRDSIPAVIDIDNALSHVGYNRLRLDSTEQTVFFEEKGVEIDLSAIAKGYAVDRAIEALRQKGFKSMMVNAGGDLYTFGKKNLFNKWRIGIINPKNKKGILKVLRISNEAVATSGGYEQFFTYKNKQYTHLINPKTGYPIEKIFSSVSVIAPNCTLADGIATAVAVGGEKSRKGIKQSYPEIEIILDE